MLVLEPRLIARSSRDSSLRIIALEEKIIKVTGTLEESIIKVTGKFGRYRAMPLGERGGRSAVGILGTSEAGCALAQSGATGRCALPWSQ